MTIRDRGLRRHVDALMRNQAADDSRAEAAPDAPLHDSFQFGD